MKHLTRHVALGAATLAGIGGLAVALPAVASPSYTVVCSTANVDVARGASTTFNLECLDSEGDPVDSYELVKAPTKAAAFTLDPETGAVTYQSVPTARGTDSFTFKGVTTLGESPVTTATVSFANERPTCEPVAAQSVIHDRVLSFPVACADADGDPVTVEVGTIGASHGQVTTDGTEVTYRPAEAFVGQDTFTLRARDGVLASDEVTVGVSVTNQAPVCTASSVSVRHDRNSSVALKCADADGDAITHRVSAAPQHGRATVVGDKVTYRPAARYLGRDSFKVTATDGIATSKVAAHSIKVTNAAPTCVKPRQLNVKRGRFVAVRVVCRDTDGDAVKLVVTKKPAFGKVVIKGNKVTFKTPGRKTGRVVFKVVGRDNVSTGRAVAITVNVRR